MIDLGLGYKGEDPKDDRDHPLGLLRLGEAPESASLRDKVVNVLSQGSLNSCVANSFAQAVRMQEIARGIQSPELCSRLFGYYYSRKQHGDEDNDAGTYIRLAIKAYNELGRPPESEWEYDPKNVNEQPPTRTLFHGHDRRAARYYRIAGVGEDRVTELKQAIAAGYPVIFGTSVSEAFTQYKGGDPMDIPTDQIIGGHAMVFAEYDASGAAGPNSWGINYGEAGWFKMTWEYVKWHQTRDLWAIRL